VEWWWPDQRVKRAKGQVKTALAQLVAKGLQIAREGAGGRGCYQVDQEKRRVIRQLLGEEQHEKE
jgi:hypothetical protein